MKQHKVKHISEKIYRHKTVNSETVVVDAGCEIPLLLTKYFLSRQDIS